MPIRVEWACPQCICWRIWSPAAHNLKFEFLRLTKVFYDSASIEVACLIPVYATIPHHYISYCVLRFQNNENSVASWNYRSTRDYQIKRNRGEAQQKKPPTYEDIQNHRQLSIRKYRVNTNLFRKFWGLLDLNVINFLSPLTFNTDLPHVMSCHAIINLYWLTD